MALFEDYIAFIANYNISSGQFTVVLSVLVIAFIFYSALLNNQHLIIKVIMMCGYGSPTVPKFVI